MLAEQKAGGYSTKYRFTGKEEDEETGLYYFGARYYDPRILLWYGVDPMTEDGLEYSPYIYTFNNPILFVDPNGEWPTPAEMKAFGKGMVKGAVIGVVGGLAVGALIAQVEPQLQLLVMLLLLMEHMKLENQPMK
ncbi:MAG: RHS repeat-associated core domain-containing protein [Saprospiraceae bacterium]|nr:RHS repeat-associated core domain-containing protein [Candidatus Vicinibacter affinis]